MEENKPKPSVLKAVIAVVIIIVAIWYFFGGGLEKQADHNMAEIENKVALDAVKQYEIAKTGGDKMEIYAHASMVVAAYLQAKDEVNYKKWKEIERADAKAAGMAIR
jgi:uncharacterized membrane protein YdfJ with MMPL/SSD domain